MTIRRPLGGTLFFLLGGAAFACGPTASPGPIVPLSPAPTVAASPSVSARDVSGTWMFGSQAEPSPGPVVGCYPFKLWNLTQTGTSVTGDVQACIGPCSAYTEGTHGTNTDGHVTLTGTEQPNPGASPVPVTYDLTFNAQTGHLVGTRNGAPFWAAPFVQRPSAECGPAPL